MTKIDTTKNFTKYVGSQVGAEKLVRSLIGDSESLDCTTAVRGRNICYSKGTQKNFTWYYDAPYKCINITYTDRRPYPEKIVHKNTYYVIWVEGLSAANGEKILSINSGINEYTTKMTRAMRVLPEHLERVKSILHDRGVASWVLTNPQSFVKVHYAPKGTLYKP